MGNWTSNYPLAPTAVQPLDMQPLASASVDLTSVATTDILNLSDAGQIALIGLLVTGAITGTPAAVLRLNIDGAGAEDITLYDTANTWPESLQALAPANDGDAVGDRFLWPVSIPFATSAVVQAVVSGAGTGSAACRLSVWYGLEL